MGQPNPIPPPLPPKMGRPFRSSRWGWRALWPGGFLVLLGTYFLLSEFHLLDWLNWDIAWPVILIVIGVLLLVRRRA